MHALLRHCRVLQCYWHSSLGSRQCVLRLYAQNQHGSKLRAAAAGQPDTPTAAQLTLQQTAAVLEPQPAGTFHVSFRDLAGKGKVRLDAFLAAQLPSASRAKISASIKAGLITVNGSGVTKPSQGIKGGDVIVVSLLPPEPCTAIPEAIPLDVVFEDDHLIVVNKAAGMVVHLSPGHSTGTLVNALLAHCGLPPCEVACGSSSSSSGGSAGLAASGGGLLSVAAGSGVGGAAAAAALGVIGGMLEDECNEGEDEEYDTDLAQPFAEQQQFTDSSVGSSSSSRMDLAAADQSRLGSQAISSSSNARGIIRPGIVHRLDRGTSGLMVVAKTDFTHAHLCGQFKQRSVSRIYNSITMGVPSPSAARIATNITRDPGNRLRMMAAAYGSSRGRTAASNYQCLEVLAGGGAALVQWKLETGRTHQIRVHARHIVHPLLGDDLYGPGHAAAARTVIGKRSSLLAAARAAVEGFGRPALHAKTLGFTHPVTGKRLEFESQLPEDFIELYQQLQEWV